MDETIVDEIIGNNTLNNTIDDIIPAKLTESTDKILPAIGGSLIPAIGGSSMPNATIPNVTIPNATIPAIGGSSIPAISGSSITNATDFSPLKSIDKMETKILKKEKPRTTPIRSSSSTPNMKKITLVKIPEYNSPVKSPIKIPVKPETVKMVEPIETVKTESVKTDEPVKPEPVPVIKDGVPIAVGNAPMAAVGNAPIAAVGNAPIAAVQKAPISPKESVVKNPIKPAKTVPEKVKPTKVQSHDTLTHIRSKIPKYHEMSIEEQDKCRRNFSSRYNILRETWKNHDIPEIKDSMSLEDIHEEYEVYVKNIHVSQSTDKYKVYMVVMWLFIEYGCIQMGLNVGGYTMSQMKSMSKYERLLIELGEKNYKYAPLGDTTSEWPVEFNILFMALVNAAIFIVIKMLCEKINMGDGIANTIIETMSSYLSGAQPQPGNVLFGGSHRDVSDIPSQNNPMNGLDLPSIISGLGNMFLQGQKPAENTQGKTPKFKPVYEE